MNISPENKLPGCVHVIIFRVLFGPLLRPLKCVFNSSLTGLSISVLKLLESAKYVDVCKVSYEECRRNKETFEENK